MEKANELKTEVIEIRLNLAAENGQSIFLRNNFEQDNLPFPYSHPPDKPKVLKKKNFCLKS